MKDKQKFKDRQEPIFISLCLKCNKEFNSKEAKIRRLKNPISLINSVCVCPNCNKDTYDFIKGVSFAKNLKVVNDKGQELIYKESTKWVKGLGHNDGYYIKEVLK